MRFLDCNVYMFIVIIHFSAIIYTVAFFGEFVKIFGI